MVLKFVNHSKRVLRIATSMGWRVGARYTNLRDVREMEKIDFIDIDWKNYDFDRHIFAVRNSYPILTIARDIEDVNNLDEILLEAEKLSVHSKYVAIVPKDVKLSELMESLIQKKYIFGYSVRTKYGGTDIDVRHFKRPVHLLGGRPDVQRKMASNLNVFSFDCNRFTYDARYGDYFNGDRFVPHPVGGYDLCLDNSIRNINNIWEGYSQNNHVVE